MNKCEQREPLPTNFDALFWDCQIDPHDWQAHQSFVVRRVLTDGTWDHVSWLRRNMGDPTLTTWLLNHQGSSLSPQQLRFWELILNLPGDIVDAWIADPMRKLWFERNKR